MAENTYTPHGTARAVTGQTRRQAFTALGATALAGIGVAAFSRPDVSSAKAAEALSEGGEGDARLIALCAQMDALEHRFRAISNEDLESERGDLEAISAAQYPIVMEISAIRAVTVDGLRAKANSLLLWAPDLGEPELEADTVGQLSWSILRDLTEGLSA